MLVIPAQQKNWQWNYKFLHNNFCFWCYTAFKRHNINMQTHLYNIYYNNLFSLLHRSWSLKTNNVCSMSDIDSYCLATKILLFSILKMKMNWWHFPQNTKNTQVRAIGNPFPLNVFSRCLEFCFLGQFLAEQDEHCNIWWFSTLAHW